MSDTTSAKGSTSKAPYWISVPFVQVSHTALALIKDGNTLLVYVALSKYVNNKTGEAYPKHKTLATDTNLSVVTVRRHLGKLRELGLLEWKTGTHGRSNTYKMRPAVLSPASSQGDHGRSTRQSPVNAVGVQQRPTRVLNRVRNKSFSRERPTRTNEPKLLKLDTTTTRPSLKKAASSEDEVVSRAVTRVGGLFGVGGLYGPRAEVPPPAELKAPDATQKTTSSKPNKYAGLCCMCREPVEADAGRLIGIKPAHLTPEACEAAVNAGRGPWGRVPTNGLTREEWTR